MNDLCLNNSKVVIRKRRVIHLGLSNLLLFFRTEFSDWSKIVRFPLASGKTWAAENVPVQTIISFSVLAENESINVIETVVKTQPHIVNFSAFLQFRISAGIVSCVESHDSSSPEIN